MNYTDIINAAMSYSDRANDPEVVSNMPKFLTMVESRLNRLLQVYKASVAVQIPMVETDEYYDLPDLMLDINSIKVVETATGIIKCVPDRVATSYFDFTAMDDMPNTGVYAISKNKLRIRPFATSDYHIEIDYIKGLTPISISVSNFIADTLPDCYVFGVTAEIYAFAKDPDGFSIWDGRFKESTSEAYETINNAEWSGTPLVMKVL